MLMIKSFALAFLVLLKITSSVSQEAEFTFNGFASANLTLDGVAYIESNGLLRLTNETSRMKGHAFHPSPIRFGRTTSSFSTTFVFAIISEYVAISSNGMAFFISPSKNLSAALPGQYLGFLNNQNVGNATNHIFAIELDTNNNPEFNDMNDNHVGIDINSLISSLSFSAGYHDDLGSFNELSLKSGKAMQVWVEYWSNDTRISVSLSPIGMSQPKTPLLVYHFNLSTVLGDSMYVGFSSSTGSIRSSHYILGWSFKLNGPAPSLDLSKLPKLPHGRSKVLEIVMPFASVAFIILVVFLFLYVKRRFRYTDLLEDWEVEFGPHLFSYKDLYRATNGSKEKELLGSGGFGRVYKGVLPVSKMKVAVKRVTHESNQGIKQFIAEVVSIGRLRHRNLVQLLGYCRSKGELLLVYDYMPNGSLDKYLYGHENPTLNWIQRINIIKGVALGILYLHEEWEQVVIHRDIKASNVLLDCDLNARLGDFGLARLYDHDTDPQTTHLAGTMGYIAPELARTGKATTLTDVFAFGAFLLEVVCGKRPLHPGAQGERTILVDWVLEIWKFGLLADIVDPRLGDCYTVEEVDMVLKLGLLCSHPLPSARPSMRQVVQYMEGDASIPELSAIYMNYSTLAMLQNEGFDSYVLSNPSTMTSLSCLSSGR
ncbi:L-type lectin-domain containing receptor kinase SIT2-like [Carex rostrata]